MNKPCELRLVDDRGAEREWAWTHIGYFVFAPPSINKEIERVIGHPVHCMGIEKIVMPLGNEIWMNRVFIQTGEKDGNYFLTYEIMSKDLCRHVKQILQRTLSDEQRAEMEEEYQRKTKEWGA